MLVERGEARSATKSTGLAPGGGTGSPDVANRSQRWAVFVHGCYWHDHRGCRRATVPKRNTEFWLEKFAGNRRRDARALRQLRARGYRALVIWECEVERKREAVAARVRRVLCSQLTGK